MYNLESWLEQTKETWSNIPEYQVDKSKLSHLAIICDGNRRAARALGFDPIFGHRVGVDVIKGVARASRKWGIETLTFWVWSTENWSRNSEQTEFVMKLAKDYLTEENFIKELLEADARFTHFGRKDRLPFSLGAILTNLENRTSQKTRFRLNLAMDYGGLDEMARAIIRMEEENFDYHRLRDYPELLLQFLDSTSQVSPDLIIRTGVGEDELIHTSGFMPLQTGYSSWIFMPDFFPNLTSQNLINEIERYSSYKKRMGR